MDFSIYPNSTMILDQSGQQQIGFLIAECKIDIYKFWREKNIEAISTTMSANELKYQANQPNLFGINSSVSNSVTPTDLNDKQEYVLSSANGSLTKKELDYNGFPVKVVANSEESKTFKTPFWNTTIYYQRIIRKIENKKRGYADKSNLNFARNLQQKKEKFFLSVNDNDQIKQSENFEGFKYLRPVYFLVWMVTDNYITRQKAVWAYEKLKKENSQWVEKGLNFKDIFKKLTQ